MLGVVAAGSVTKGVVSVSVASVVTFSVSRIVTVVVGLWWCFFALWCFPGCLLAIWPRKMVSLVEGDFTTFKA